MHFNSRGNLPRFLLGGFVWVLLGWGLVDLPPARAQSATPVRVTFLHHSTGGCVWEGGVPAWFTRYNQGHGTQYQIAEHAFPDSPYEWANYPYDYWNLWINPSGPANTTQSGVYTLEQWCADAEVVVFKHCFPVSSIGPDEGTPSVSSSEKTLANYKLQYAALKVKLHQFPTKKFIVWTGAALTQGSTNPEDAARAREFFAWVCTTWDEPGDNIFVWDFWTLETEGGLYLKEAYSSDGDSHPNGTFCQRVAPFFSQRVVDVIEGRGDTGSLTGEPVVLAAPDITRQPEAAATVAGTTAQFQVAATSAGTLQYRWQGSTDGGVTWSDLSDGAGYLGTATDHLSVLTPTAGMRGYQYRCAITDGVNPPAHTTAATLTVQWSQLAALSARAPVGTGDQTLILGFVFAGGGKPTLIRGVGPGLVKGDANLAGQVLVDPVLTLNELQTGGFVAIATNDNWGGTDELRTKMSMLGMGALDDNSTDAVMLTTPTRAVYTAQISGANQTTGLALAEVYDANFADTAKRLTALSVRNQVGTGSGVLIVGFVLSGDAPKKVIIRGVGPGLVKDNPNLAGQALANPTLQLHQLNTTTMTWSVVGANDDWGGTAELTAAMKAVGMGALDADSKDAALLLELPAGLGIYTAQLSGVGETTGLGLVEIYEAP